MSSTSNSDTDDGPVVPRQVEASGSSGPAPKTPRKLINEAPKRNKIIWEFFTPDPNFVKKGPRDHAKVETGHLINLPLAILNVKSISLIP